MSVVEIPSKLCRIDLGYDALIDSYFVQVRKTDETGTLQLHEWLGSGSASAVYGGLIHDPNIVIRHASLYSRVPEGLADILRAERLQQPKLVEVEQVTYIGIPLKEVWRLKVGVDPDHGKRIEVNEHEIYSWTRQVAYTLLMDVLGHRLRARQLANEFGYLIEHKIRKRYWLLTESDIQMGIFTVERKNSLHWLSSQLCYAGKVTPLDGSPEAQLRRAAEDRDTMQLFESGLIGLNQDPRSNTRSI